jgi:hypothetical protein
MHRKWIVSLAVLPLLALTYAYGSRGQTSPTVGEVKPVLTVGQDIPVEISASAQEVLQGVPGEFKPAIPQPNLPVSAQKTLELANKAILPALTQPPIKTTVEFVLYTDKPNGIIDKPVWKVVYWGSPLMMTGSPANVDGSTPQVKQPSSKRAITYVLIDPTDPEAKSDFVATGSAGPVHD